MKYLLCLLLTISTLSSCTVLTHNRVFPTVTWAWTDEAANERGWRDKKAWELARWKKEIRLEKERADAEATAMPRK